MLAVAVGPETRIRNLAEQVLTRAGYDLVDVEYRRESDGWKVRLYIDKPGGVNLDDCQRVSHEFGTLLEVEDPIPHRYTLEVSSPGLDRPLKRPSDFTASVGKKVRLVTREAVEGRRNFAGRLVSAVRGQSEGEELLLTVRDDGDVEHVLPASMIDRAHVEYEWPDAGGRKAGREHGRHSGKKPGKKKNSGRKR